MKVTYSKNPEFVKDVLILFLDNEYDVQLDINNDSDFKDKKIKDFGIDSLDIVEILMFIEQNFGIDNMSDNAFNFETFQDIIDYVNTPPQQQ